MHDETISRTCRLSRRRHRPKQLTTALFEMTVRSFTPDALISGIRLSGLPTSPKPPDMTQETTALIDPLALSREVDEPYRNVSLGPVNDHEIRMSVMTEQFRWHRHPDSDETFYGVDGELIIEFIDSEVVVHPGEMITVPPGTHHRTRPAGERSVNLTVERSAAETFFEDPPVTP